LILGENGIEIIEKILPEAKNEIEYLCLDIEFA
jgi:hypothetical protein